MYTSFFFSRFGWANLQMVIRTSSSKRISAFKLLGNTFSGFRCFSHYVSVEWMMQKRFVRGRTSVSSVWRAVTKSHETTAWWWLYPPFLLLNSLQWVLQVLFIGKCPAGIWSGSWIWLRGIRIMRGIPFRYALHGIWLGLSRNPSLFKQRGERSVWDNFLVEWQSAAEIIWIERLCGFGHHLWLWVMKHLRWKHQ